MSYIWDFRESGIQKSEVRSQKSEVGSRESGVGSRASGTLESHHTTIAPISPSLSLNSLSPHLPIFPSLPLLPVPCSLLPLLHMLTNRIIAHRGASNCAKENTIEAYEKAIEIGADFIEFDVRITKDGVLISHHDPMIANQAISQLSFGEINRIAGQQGFRVPTVEEVLKLTRNKIKLAVELKEEGYEEKVLALVMGYIKIDNFIILSFNISSLRCIKNKYPEVKTGLLLSKKKNKFLIILLRSLGILVFQKLIRLTPDILALQWETLKFGLLKIAAKQGKPVFVWTVNDKKMIGELLNDNRVDGIISDQPDLARKLLTNLEYTLRH
ncbi:MAG: glycerophosphodiester phosphodiesterase [Moorea sp. SIO4E2]|uniref:glycerophosphodiester phosphodiesterase n=1 Tax=Moorena sp. SIO4E2 TaxID=2607826 RepID=UPI0013BCB334|nr:glycerophosphodiester phosphodiesterase [Moorena sp. SIO4E2]NEQ07836.1 glycerophosphodiester phosphodiesterase [Moorena sp. SIO4E2]